MRGVWASMAQHEARHLLNPEFFLAGLGNPRKQYCGTLAFFTDIVSFSALTALIGQGTSVQINLNPSACPQAFSIGIRPWG